MATLRSQFNQALTNIEINGKKAERARAAHREIRLVLEADDQLRAWGVDTILIGSYSRDTGIYPGKDVDVFVKLTGLDTSAMPRDVYDAVWDVLVRQYGDANEGGRATGQARSIKVAFPDEDDPGDGNASFSVDSVPAVRDGTRWAIPAKDRNRWTGRTGCWVTTDPEWFGSLSSALSTSPVSPAVGDRNAYKPIVKLTRQARRTHVEERRPGGLYVGVHGVRGVECRLCHWKRVGSAVCANATLCGRSTSHRPISSSPRSCPWHACGASRFRGGPLECGGNLPSVGRSRGRSADSRRLRGGRLGGVRFSGAMTEPSPCSRGHQAVTEPERRPAPTVLVARRQREEAAGFG